MILQWMWSWWDVYELFLGTTRKVGKRIFSTNPKGPRWVTLYSKWRFNSTNFKEVLSSSHEKYLNIEFSFHMPSVLNYSVQIIDLLTVPLNMPWHVWVFLNYKISEIYSEFVYSENWKFYYKVIYFVFEYS